MKTENGMRIFWKCMLILFAYVLTSYFVSTLPNLYMGLDAHRILGVFQGMCLVWIIDGWIFPEIHGKREE
jgi:hypothetical protein